MIHYRENIYSLDNYERYITDSSLFENTGDGIGNGANLLI